MGSYLQLGETKQQREEGGEKKKKKRTGNKAEFDAYSLTGRCNKLPRCGWRNQAGRSQPGDWHISVGDEVEAAFKLLRENPLAKRSRTNTHMLCTVNREHTDRPI